MEDTIKIPSITGNQAKNLSRQGNNYAIVMPFKRKNPVVMNIQDFIFQNRHFFHFISFFFGGDFPLREWKLPAREVQLLEQDNNTAAQERQLPHPDLLFILL